MALLLICARVSSLAVFHLDSHVIAVSYEAIMSDTGRAVRAIPNCCPKISVPVINVTCCREMWGISLLSRRLTTSYPNSGRQYYSTEGPQGTSHWHPLLLHCSTAFRQDRHFLVYGWRPSVIVYDRVTQPQEQINNPPSIPTSNTRQELILIITNREFPPISGVSGLYFKQKLQGVVCKALYCIRTQCG